MCSFISHQRHSQPAYLAKRSLLSLCIGSALWASTGFAQDTSADDETTTPRALEHIVVTAEKVASSVQDTGMVISSYTAEDLLAGGVDDIGGIVGLTPNVQLLDATGGGVPVVFVRGVGLADFRVNNSPAAAFYVDDVYKPSVAMMASAFFDLERIEVLKGPQGGLYGRNANAGAVQVISAKANLYGTEGYLDLGLGRFGKTELEGAVNMLVTDDMAVRLSGRRVISDATYMRSVQGDTSQHHGAEDQWASRAQLYWEPSTDLDLTLKLSTGADRSETTLLRSIGLWAGGDADGDGFADGALSGQVCAALLAGQRDDSQCATITGQTNSELGLNGPFDTASAPINQLNNEWLAATLTVNYQVNHDTTVSSITHIESFDHARPTDWDAVAGVYQDFYYRTDISSFSQEVRLAYDAQNWRFFGGVNFAKDSLDEDTKVFGDLGLIPMGFGHHRVNQAYAQDVQAFAVFGRVNYPLSEQLELITELRYTNEEKSFAGQTYLVNPVGGTGAEEPVLLVDATQPDARFDDISGKLTLNYKLNRDVLTYASLSRGFKSGGFPGGLVLDSSGAEEYDSETITAYEVGFKSDLLERRLRVNAAAFYYDYRNLQGSARVPAVGGVTLDRFQNIGDAEVYGFDAELTYLLTDDWLLQASVGHAEGEITDSLASQLSPLTGEEFSLQGHELNYKPDFSANVSVRRDYELANGYSGHVELGYDWRSKQNFTYLGNLAEQTIFSEDSYGLLNLQVRVQHRNSPWQFSAFVTNLTDQRYRTNARADDLGGAFEIYGAPRIWGVKANYQF
ncbi:TonB-dependent receptor [Pseudidiomarina sediminum]|uniref:TonB-dependent receptor n=1 Tax=Pseudidiomarina sediminum TaxID=431675 RepID=A0A432ZAH6_9GAMM|nr:TonB-dependent receptor [Pseudidiomarina sediminum]RUO74945.1 TonB-dependent receptor [Pseudidiomarina sediminum]